MGTFSETFLSEVFLVCFLFLVFVHVKLLGVRIESASRIILLTAPVPKHKPQSTLF